MNGQTVTGLRLLTTVLLVTPVRAVKVVITPPPGWDALSISAVKVLGWTRRLVGHL